MTSCQSTYEGKRNQVNNFRRKPNFTSVYICRTTKCYGIITIVDNKSVQITLSAVVQDQRIDTPKTTELTRPMV